MAQKTEEEKERFKSFVFPTCYIKLYKGVIYVRNSYSENTEDSIEVYSKGIPEEFLKIATPISEKEFMSKWLDTKIYTKEEVDQMEQ